MLGVLDARPLTAGASRGLGALAGVRCCTPCRALTPLYVKARVLSGLGDGLACAEVCHDSLVGYRRITGLLRGEGWRVNHKRVERLWRREGLKVPQKQPKRGRLWLTDGSCVRCRPAYRLHVWAYDFLTARTHDGRPLKILTVVEEYSRECLAIVVARRLRSTEVLETLAELFVTHGVPAHIRSACYQ